MIHTRRANSILIIHQIARAALFWGDAMISRRQMVYSCVKAAAAVSAFGTFGPVGAAPAESSDEEKFIEWMDAATGVGREVAHGTLSVTRFSDAYWYLTRPIEWSPAQGQQLPKVTVPIGFVTDFASIPRALWIALPRDGDYVWAAVVHDYLYWFQMTSRDVADDVLNAAMKDFNIPTTDRVAIYEGLHLGGGSAWEQNAALKNAGEKRILKQFPTDPTTSWADWKTKPGVFA